MAALGSIMESSLAFATQAVHAGERAPRPDFTPVNTPIYQSASFVYDTLETMDAIFGGEPLGLRPHALWQPHGGGAGARSGHAGRGRNGGRLCIRDGRHSCHAAGARSGLGRRSGRGSGSVWRHLDPVDDNLRAPGGERPQITSPPRRRRSKLRACQSVPRSAAVCEPCMSPTAMPSKPGLSWPRSIRWPIRRKLIRHVLCLRGRCISWTHHRLI